MKTIFDEKIQLMKNQFLQMPGVDVFGRSCEAKRRFREGLRKMDRNDGHALNRLYQQYLKDLETLNDQSTYDKTI